MTSPNPHSRTTRGLDIEQPIARRLTDPFVITALAVYVLALVGLFFTARILWAALLLALGTALLSGIALVVTRGRMPQSLDVIRPKAELWLPLIWYGIVALLAAFTTAKGLELVNQFTNWLFLVIVPFGLLVLTRGRGLVLRATLRSVGFTRTGAKDALKLAAIIGPLFIPVLYLVGDQQRAAIQMVFHKPLQAILPFLVSFVLALLTAGFVEEFFFRGVLQSRLAICTGSEWRGLLVASLLFGLFHLPMYFFSPFEPTHGDFIWALASVITEQAVAGVLLGVLWIKTHNLAAPILVHAFINALAWMTTLKIGTG